jgi:hypothetical protein
VAALASEVSGGATFAITRGRVGAVVEQKANQGGDATMARR